MIMKALKYKETCKLNSRIKFTKYKCLSLDKPNKV